MLRHEAVRANSEEPRPCAMSTQSWPTGDGEGPDENLDIAGAKRADRCDRLASTVSLMRKCIAKPDLASARPPSFHRVPLQRHRSPMARWELRG